MPSRAHRANQQLNKTLEEPSELIYADGARKPGSSFNVSVHVDARLFIVLGVF
jgi:hypothetical protein